VKELLKLDSICQSYAQMKKGTVFFWLTVYIDFDAYHMLNLASRKDNTTLSIRVLLRVHYSVYQNVNVLA